MQHPSGDPCKKVSVFKGTVVISLLHMTKRKDETRSYSIDYRTSSCPACERLFDFFLMMHDHRLGQVIYVTQKHMNISVEGCTTLDLTLGFYSPIKASLRQDKSNFE